MTYLVYMENNTDGSQQLHFNNEASNDERLQFCGVFNGLTEDHKNYGVWDANRKQIVIDETRKQAQETERIYAEMNQKQREEEEHIPEFDEHKTNLLKQVSFYHNALRNAPLEYKSQTYQADAGSLAGMAEVLALHENPEQSIQWRLLDNSYIELTVAELKELQREILLRNQDLTAKKFALKDRMNAIQESQADALQNFNVLAEFSPQPPPETDAQ